VPAFDPGTGGTDVDLPRWRRPSLLAARTYDPLRDTRTSTRLTFDADGPSGVARERRIVRYRVVRLLDRPDEILGVELGTLDEGDQVEILEPRGTYRRVLTPDGREGWVHKMTLGDRVGDDAAAAATDPDIDADVLLAYMAARAHS
jgi:SH3-like domain-containing protein